MAKYLKKDDRKQQIKNASIKLIAKNGYRDTSVQNIIDKINYSKGGFYNCYSSKEALFEEILKDAMEFRLEQVKTYKELDNVDRKTVIVDALLDKLLDDTPYKKLFTALVMEMPNNKYLMNIYRQNIDIMYETFIDFCKKEGFEEYIKISNRDFGVFVNSIIIGVDIFDYYDNESYREMLKTMLMSYFDKVGLFD